MPKIVLWHHCYLVSRSKAAIKVKGHGSRSIFRHTAVDIWDSALPSAVKTNNSHYQSKLFVCVSIISMRMRIIAQMRLIGF